MKALVLLCLLPLLARPAFAASERPNLVVILSDDMGWSDIGCYGGEIRTPVLDGLARDGLRFTQFYNTGRCCPTRASLLTGLHPHQAGVGHMTDSRSELAGYAGNLNDRCLTLAEAVKPAGYRAYMAGKWQRIMRVARRWRQAEMRTQGMASQRCHRVKRHPCAQQQNTGIAKALRWNWCRDTRNPGADRHQVQLVLAP